MKILIDTNIIIDCLTAREPNFHPSKEVLRKCLDSDGEHTGFMATHTVNDIYYITRKLAPDTPSGDLVEAIVMFTKTLETADLTAEDVEAAGNLQFADFEDALISQCARKIKADYIVTRNTKDFVNSPVKALTPGAFVS